MKWILKKLIVLLVEALVVMGLVDALGIDIEGLLGGLFGDETEEPSSSDEESSSDEVVSE